MKRALLVVAAIVVALPLAGFAAAQVYLSEDALRARIEAAVLKATGRELTIAGPVRLAWSLTPTLEASDVTFANPPGFSRPAMAHVDRIAARVGLLPLLSRRVEVTGLTLTSADVLLDRDAAGRPNWEFSRPQTAETRSPQAAPGPRFTVDIGEIVATDAKLAARSVAVSAPRLSYDPGSGRVAGELAFRGSTFQVTGTAGPVFDLHAAGAGMTLAAAGTAAQTSVTAEIADLAALSALAGTNLPPVKSIRLQGQLALAPGSAALDGLQLTSSAGDLAGSLRLAAAPLPTLSGTLTSTRLDLDSLTPPPPAPAAGSQAAPPAAAAAPPDRIIPDTPIPFAALRAAEADLQLKAAAVTWRGRTATDTAAHAVLRDGRLHLSPFSATLGDETVTADLQADAGSQALDLKLDGSTTAVRPLAAIVAGSGALDLHADLHAQGGTWRAAAATLQGGAGLAMVDGQIDNAWLLDKLQAALRAANLPLAAAGDSRVRCAALRLDADAGKVRLSALTLDTSKLDLGGRGEINLADETLDLHLRPTLRLGAALSVPLHIGGTLAAPKAALDPGALEPGRVGISIGGPTLPDACGPALAAARFGQPGPVPAAPAANRPPKPADLLRGLLR